MSDPDPGVGRWQLYSVNEAVPILRMSRATIYRRLAGRDALPHHNVRGTGAMFTASDLDAILAQSARGKR